MSEPMTEAEQAVVDVLEGDSACTWHVGCDVEDCYGPRAAAIVAKLRPLLLEEAADLIENSEQLRSFTDDHMGDIEMAAEELRRAATALRTTTPEKEN
jgi:hypothetical protein